jgi:GAF domain-containing protein
VYDQPLFLQTLSKFAGALPGQYDIDEVLSELADSVAAVLGLSGSGVSLAEDGRLRFVAAVSDASGDLERIQEQSQAGPCKEAYDTGDVVRVNDVRQASDRWPAFSTAARRLGVARVAGIPMRLAEQSIGALDIYAAEPGPGRMRTLPWPASWPTWRPATSLAPPNCASRSNSTSSCSRRWTPGWLSNKPRASPRTTAVSRWIRPSN